MSQALEINDTCSWRQFRSKPGQHARIHFTKFSFTFKTFLILPDFDLAHLFEIISSLLSTSYSSAFTNVPFSLFPFLTCDKLLYDHSPICTRFDFPSSPCDWPFHVFIVTIIPRSALHRQLLKFHPSTATLYSAQSLFLTFCATSSSLSLSFPSTPSNPSTIEHRPRKLLVQFLSCFPTSLKCFS